LKGVKAALKDDYKGPDVEDRIFQLGAWPWDAEKLTHDLLNLALFKAGHKSPDLQEAYRAARSARFEDWR
jgi:hypothetical protein